MEHNGQVLQSVIDKLGLNSFGSLKNEGNENIKSKSHNTSERNEKKPNGKQGLQVKDIDLAAEYAKFFNFSEDIVTLFLGDFRSVAKSIHTCKNCGVGKCNGFKFMFETVNGFPIFFAVRCNKDKASMEQAKAERLFENSGTPKIYKGIDLKSYKVNKENKTAIQYAREAISGNVGLFLHGESGIGKTMLASIIANEKIKEQKSVLFATVADIIEDLRQGYEDNRQSEKARLAREVDVLILDDIGAEKPTEWSTEKLFAIINSRMNDQKQTIYTSNKGLFDLSQSYGDTGARLASRINGTCRICKIGGSDERLGVSA